MVERLLSQLAFVEVITPKPEESLKFYRDILGLEVSAQRGQSVYLRGWGEFFHHSLILTEGRQAEVTRSGWRTEGPEELEAAARRLEKAGAGIGWREPDVGIGRAYRYRSPGGHVFDLFWDYERARISDAMASPVPNRPQRFAPRGAAVRRIDHVTYNTDDPLRDARWFADTLGYRFTEFARFDHNPDIVLAAFNSTTPMSHDLGLIRDAVDRTGKLSGVKGRCNHIAFWLDQHEDVLRAADIYRGAGIQVEFGPGKHGVGENFFLYAREPGGMRVELFSGGYMQYAPDVYPFEWKVSQGVLNAWSPHYMAPEAFLFDAFPMVEPSPNRAKAPEHA